MDRFVEERPADGFCKSLDYGMLVKRSDGMLDCYVNVHELARWFKIIIDFPEAWRLLTVQ
ncbi:hypothetical protein VE01_01381 [Pseudogymnoascus verrucosus]|uniref:Uncharacterized protein n=1 Tax=Pseudogymnoascus verrucosus TaxID=342668 RepID=A0A1B8GX17_9PEZI|nr:uncharacterized protein VE01_01381 [Pseudogymnoascus verrucosus]OBU00403.1 hypothetical protein VE01_01381 [Pseudogymnoascus verrucosus]